MAEQGKRTLVAMRHAVLSAILADLGVEHSERVVAALMAANYDKSYLARDDEKAKRLWVRAVEGHPSSRELRQVATALASLGGTARNASARIEDMAKLQDMREDDDDEDS